MNNATNEVTLSLLENGHAFLNEAVEYAISADNDARKWQFAVLNLVQSLELSLKSLLHTIHPAFIYEDVDKQKNTVSARRAVSRIEAVSDEKFSNREKKQIENVLDLRNRWMHSDVALNVSHAKAKFFQVFYLIQRFQRDHFQGIGTIIQGGRLEKLREIETYRSSLVDSAKQRMRDEGLQDDEIWICPNCECDTFVASVAECFLCDFEAELSECGCCRKIVFSCNIENFLSELDFDVEEGFLRIHNDYGYSYHEACQSCIEDIYADIHAKQNDDDYY